MTTRQRMIDVLAEIATGGASQDVRVEAASKVLSYLPFDDDVPYVWDGDYNRDTDPPKPAPKVEVRESSCVGNGNLYSVHIDGEGCSSFCTCDWRPLTKQIEEMLQVVVARVTA